MPVINFLEFLLQFLFPKPLKPQPRVVDENGPCCKRNDLTTRRACLFCKGASCNHCRGLYNGYWICSVCRDELKTALESERATQRDLPSALIGGLAAAAFAGTFWAMIAVETGYVLYIFTIGVGIATGFGSFIGSGFKRGPSIQVIALITALISILIGRYIIDVYNYERSQGIYVTVWNWSFMEYYVLHLWKFIGWWDYLFIIMALSTAWVVPQPRTMSLR